MRWMGIYTRWGRGGACPDIEELKPEIFKQRLWYLLWGLVGQGKEIDSGGRETWG